MLPTYDVTKIYSSSSLTLNIFKNVYLDEKTKIPSAPNRNIYMAERESYYGGFTSNFKKIFKSENNEKLYYYDINSSYPNVMKNKLMPVEYISKEIYNMEGILG